MSTKKTEQLKDEDLDQAQGGFDYVLTNVQVTSVKDDGPKDSTKVVSHPNGDDGILV